MSAHRLDPGLHLDLDALRFDAAGLVPVVAQDVATGAWTIRLS